MEGKVDWLGLSVGCEMSDGCMDDKKVLSGTVAVY